MTTYASHATKINVQILLYGHTVNDSLDMYRMLYESILPSRVFTEVQMLKQ